MLAEAAAADKGVTNVYSPVEIYPPRNLCLRQRLPLIVSRMSPAMKNLLPVKFMGFLSINAPQIL